MMAVTKPAFNVIRLHVKSHEIIAIALVPDVRTRVFDRLLEVRFLADITNSKRWGLPTIDATRTA